MSRKVLVVDDEPDILAVVLIRLKSSGYTVTTVDDGGKALDEVQANRPDVIILDVRLPTIDGQEVCRQLKADESTKSIPVILFTASTDNVVEIKEQCGADDYLVKPFEAQVLIEKIEQFVS